MGRPPETPWTAVAMEVLLGEVSPLPRPVADPGVKGKRSPGLCTASRLLAPPPVRLAAQKHLDSRNGQRCSCSLPSPAHGLEPLWQGCMFGCAFWVFFGISRCGPAGVNTYPLFRQWPPGARVLILGQCGGGGAKRNAPWVTKYPRPGPQFPSLRTDRQRRGLVVRPRSPGCSHTAPQLPTFLGSAWPAGEPQTQGGQVPIIDKLGPQ